MLRESPLDLTFPSAEYSSLGDFLRQRRLGIDPNVATLGPHRRFPQRVGRRVSQEEIAEALRVSREWYARLELGNKYASARLLQRVSEVFCLSSWERVELLRLGAPDFASLLPPSVQAMPA